MTNDKCLPTSAGGHQIRKDKETKTKTMTGTTTRLVFPSIQFITHIHQLLYMTRSSKCAVWAVLIFKKIKYEKEKKKKKEVIIRH
jgi:hypothetical protein